MDKFFNTLAVTGGIGSGKSTVLKLFEQNNFEVINVDLLAHTLLFNTSPYYNKYASQIDQWLNTNYALETQINRDQFRNLLINTENGFQKIAAMAKPYIILLMKEIYLKKQQEGVSIIFEVPLLVESNLQYLFNQVLVVVADVNVRKERIKIRDPHLTDNDINNRLNIQSTDAEKIAIANYVIDNSGTVSELEKQFYDFLSQYQKDIRHNSKTNLLHK
jgi:dephospho-CoA kinase